MDEKIDWQHWIAFGAFVSLPYFYIKKGHNIDSDDALISLATVCDLNLLEDTKQFAINYESGPISIAVYIDSDFRTHSQQKQMQLKSLFDKYFTNINNKYDIIIGILYINTKSAIYIERKFTISTPLMFKLPTNALRNLAEYQINTKYLMNIDVDFYYLSQSLSKINEIKLKNILENESDETIFIIPAFELMINNDDNNYYSLNKKQLIDLINNDEIAPFHESMQSQKCTNYSEWYKSSRIYVIKYKDISHCSWSYEPWYIMNTNISKSNKYKWDNDYIGRGLNKVQRTFKLRHYCFKFIVMNDLFIIHSKSLHLYKTNFTQTDKEKWHSFNNNIFQQQRYIYYADPKSCSYNYRRNWYFIKRYWYYIKTYWYSIKNHLVKVVTASL